MIRSFYHHGAEVPATDLSREQMRAALADAGGVLWVDMLAPNPEDAEKVLTRVFGFHPLTIRDCFEGVRRPKLDDYGDYIFFVIHANDQSTPLEDVHTVELHIYLGSNFVVTYHLLPLPAIDRVSRQVMQDELLMARGADIMIYEILRAVESDYQPTVDYLSAAIAGVEVEVLTAPTGKTLRRIHELHNDLLKVRRVLAPQQSVVSRLAAQELQPIRGGNRLYFHELTDRFGQMVEMIDVLSESIRSARQTHLSVVSNQNNKLLRLVVGLVTLVLSLSVFAVLFDTSHSAISAPDMPYAYVASLGITLLAAAFLALYFYRRSWQ